MTISDQSKQLQKPQILSYISLSLNYTPFDVKWIPGTARIVIVGQHARGAGVVQVYEMNEGKLELISQDDKAAAIKCLTFGYSSQAAPQFATGDFTGRLQLWDVERLKVPTWSHKGHEQVINCIDGIGGSGGANVGPPEIATGGRDGFVRVWDSRKSDGPVMEMGPERAGAGRDCWSVCFGDSHSRSDRSLVAGYDNGDVKLFDMRARACVWDDNVGNGVCSVGFDRRDIMMNKLVVGGLEGTMRVYDMRTKHEEKGYTSLSHKMNDSTTVWTVKHVPQNRDLFMASNGTGRLSLFKYRYPAKRVEKDKDGKEYGVTGTLEVVNYCDIAEQPISSFDWNADKLGLCCFTAFDQMVRIGIVTKMQTL